MMVVERHRHPSPTTPTVRAGRKKEKMNKPQTKYDCSFYDSRGDDCRMRRYVYNSLKGLVRHPSRCNCSDDISKCIYVQEAIKVKRATTLSLTEDGRVYRATGGLKRICGDKAVSDLLFKKIHDNSER